METTCCELKWLKELLHFFGVFHAGSMHLYCDSKAALHIAANPIFHERTKHIEIDCHFVRNELLKGHIYTHHVRTKEQLADILTNGLGTTQFDYLHRKSGIQNLNAQT